jgi:glycerophosphoryl diester phosphodiesterase
VFLGLLGTGCASPRSVTNLRAVLEQEGLGVWQGPDYRCTRGAHRGASEDYRENTLAALAAAQADDRFAFIEFDVQYAKDGRIVVYHDRRMLRLFGSPRSIGNTTFEDLLLISRGEIAAYDEVMRSLTGKKLNIEVKSQGDLVEDQRLVDEIVADLCARGRERDVLLSSISTDVVRYITLRYPAFSTGQIRWLTSSTYLHFDRLTRRLYEEIVDSQADYLMLHVANLRNLEKLLELKPRGKAIVFWDFDDRMYLVHKDFSDRLWGDSWWTELARRARYALSGRRTL